MDASLISVPKLREGVESADDPPCTAPPPRDPGFDSRLRVANMSLFGFGPSAKVEVTLAEDPDRKTVKVQTEEKTEELFIYSGEDSVAGSVKVILPSGKKLEHVGIKVELIGAIGKWKLGFFFVLGLPVLFILFQTPPLPQLPPLLPRHLLSLLLFRIDTHIFLSHSCRASPSRL